MLRYIYNNTNNKCYVIVSSYSIEGLSIRQTLYELYCNYEHVQYILRSKNYSYKNVYSLYVYRFRFLFNLDLTWLIALQKHWS